MYDPYPRAKRIRAMSAPDRKQRDLVETLAKREKLEARSTATHLGVEEPYEPYALGDEWYAEDLYPGYGAIENWANALDSVCGSGIDSSLGARLRWPIVSQEHSLYRPPPTATGRASGSGTFRSLEARVADWYTRHLKPSAHRNAEYEINRQPLEKLAIRALVARAKARQDDRWRKVAMIAFMTQAVWLRPPSRFIGESPRQFLRHLFGTGYVPPAILDSVFADKSLVDLPLPWLITRARGGNLLTVLTRLGHPIAAGWAAQIEAMPSTEKSWAAIVKSAELRWLIGREIDQQRE